MHMMIMGRGSQRPGQISFTKIGRMTVSPSVSASESESSVSSVEYKKKKRSFLKCSSLWKKKEYEDSLSSHSHPQPKKGSVKVGKLRGILKNNKSNERERDIEREKLSYYSSSDEDDEHETEEIPFPHDRCLVGRVAQTPGARKGRGGGLALIVRKSKQNGDHLYKRNMHYNNRSGKR